jgi:hypothetical protein
MDKHEPTLHKHPLFAIITTGFVFWLWISLLLTLSNAFFTPLLWILAGVTIGSGAYFIYTKKLCKNISREFLIIACIAITLAAAMAFITTPTIFSGRDQGSYSTAAIHLVQNHKLAFSTSASTAFFALHGPGKALNFPGFDYTVSGLLTTQFPLGYIAWLASFFALFGLLGLVIANAVTLALFLIAFYFLIRIFASRFYATWGFVLAATSLPAVWFSKITLSENLALVLFTLIAINLVLAIKEKSTLFSILAVALAGFFTFTRIEGLAFLLVTLIIISLFTKARTVWKSKPVLYAIIPTLAFSLLLIRSFFIDFPFYKTIAKAGLNKWQSFFKPCIAADCIADKSLSLWSVFFTYGLIPVFIIGSVSIIIFFRSRYKLALIPFLLALPTFFYLFSPSISIDQPWMLRRFIFSLYPCMLFSAIIGIAIVQDFLTKRYAKRFLFKKYYYALILLSALVFAQLPFAFQYAAFSENKGLLEQTKTLSQHFSNKDLILVDRLATGDAWSMIPEPLNFFGITNAVYFFNPEDFATLNTSAFENVYLIVSETEAPRYLEATSKDTQTPLKHFTPFTTFTFNSDRLAPSTDSTLPQKVRDITKVLILKVE